MELKSGGERNPKRSTRGSRDLALMKEMLNLPWLEPGCYSSPETKPGMKALAGIFIMLNNIVSRALDAWP